MKFLCLDCDEPMKLHSTAGPDEGSLSVTFRCPECGFRVAMRSQERFQFYAALGLTLIVAIQMLINVSVSLCLLPTKGLPLPLVSYGGSSLIASLMGIGILLNLSQQSS